MDSPITATNVAADSPIIVIGDKSKAQLSRVFPDNIQLSFNQIGRSVPTFADAASVADLILSNGIEYDSAVIVYNKFISTISYEAAAVEIKGASSLKESGEDVETHCNAPQLTAIV